MTRPFCCRLPYSSHGAYDGQATAPRPIHLSFAFHHVSCLRHLQTSVGNSLQGTMAQPLLMKMIEGDDRPPQQSNGHQTIDEPALKSGETPGDTLRVNRGAIRMPSPDPSAISIDDSNNIRLGQTSVHVPFYGESYDGPSPAPPGTLKGRIQASWIANKGLALVLISQVFGTLMNVTTRILEMEGNDGKIPRSSRRVNVLTIHRQRLSSLPDSLC